MQNYDRNWIEHGYGMRIQSFQNLMRHRISDVLLVSSLYDLYLIEEDGRLYELIRKEYQGLRLSHSPEITRVSKANDALNLLQGEKRFDLVIITLHTEDMHPEKFAKKMREMNIDTPVILLAFDNAELHELIIKHDTQVFDKVFLWQGDYRLLIGMIKFLEDKMNVEHDTESIGVQSIIVIEDDIRNYSSFLPIIYTEVIKQANRLTSEGINLSHKYLRMRARPKILLCSTFEEAWRYFEKYDECILGVISDIDFIHKGKADPKAGIEFASAVRKRYTDIPILLQSSEPENETEAKKIGVSFLLKNSPTLLYDLREFMTNNFCFGDFVFRRPDGKEISRATDLISLEKNLKNLPAESIKYHSERNHFSNWLKARTEFWLAEKLRPQRVIDFESIEEIRAYLIKSLRNYRKLRQKGIITDFHKDTFDSTYSFARIGGGSLGGKARGLSFLNKLIYNYEINEKFEGIYIGIPPGVVIGTDVFDQFLEENNLRNFALNCTDDEEIKSCFLEAKRFPEETLNQLKDFLEIIKEPLSVRSSSLLEDSQYHPFAGVYETYMIPNNNENPVMRLGDLINTIILVYASTFYNNSKDYIKITNYRLEEEKMAVIIQKMIGCKHNNRFYPDFSGVAKTYNFYPISPIKSNDGIVSVALGLGKTIVEGGTSIRFCPKYPTHLIQLYSTKEALNNNQQEFFALDLDTIRDLKNTNVIVQEEYIKKYEVKTAESDGTLNYVASTYSTENDSISDGISRNGIRLITFSPILKNKIFPLPQILEKLLDLSSWGMGTAVEIEFAVNMSVPPGEKKFFSVLQMRPLVVSQETEELDISEIHKNKILCQSNEVLGNGIIKDIYDIVYVDFHKFDRSQSRDVAHEVNQLNSKMLDEGKPYLLIGVGRWGTLDPWLGIPVTWSQISGARVIIEAGMKDLIVEPSQGSHFFQNLTSFSIGYFTVNTTNKFNKLDWEWLYKQKTIEEKEFVKHIRLKKPLTVKMNAHENLGVILKP
jgi:phosphoenolpyruvate synthase/pyruvate phosphate dikinase/CheY-like chemotaxis protein